jgi:hypothetical protein
MACYALFCLSLPLSDTPFTLPPMVPTTTYYYLDLREKPQAHFAGICGYPPSSQQEAARLLVQLRLETILPSFYVCPPVDAILQDDPHYVLVEEQDVDRDAGKQWMQDYRHATLQEALWLQLMSPLNTQPAHLILPPQEAVKRKLEEQQQPVPSRKTTASFHHYRPTILDVDGHERVSIII